MASIRTFDLGHCWFGRRGCVIEKMKFGLPLPLVVFTNTGTIRTDFLWLLKLVFEVAPICIMGAQT